MKRAIWVGVACVVLIVSDQLFARVLASREPLQAILTGQFWVGLLAVAALGLRLVVCWALPAWLAASAIEGVLRWRERGRSAPARPR